MYFFVSIIIIMVISHTNSHTIAGQMSATTLISAIDVFTHNKAPGDVSRSCGTNAGRV